MIPVHRKFYSPWITVGACALAVTIAYGAVFSFGVFINPLRESFVKTSAAVSGAYSITLWVFAVSGILAGWAVDNYGPRITIMVGSVILGTGFLLTSVINSFWQLYVTCGLIGVGLSSGYVPTMTTISRSFEEHRGLALGLNSAGVGLGPLIIAPLATYFISVNGWRSTYLAMAILAGFIVPVALLIKRYPADQDERSGGQKIYLNGTIEENKDKGITPLLSGWKEIKRVSRTRTFWLFCLLFLTIGICVQTVIVHIVPYCQAQGETPMTAAAVLSTLTGASILGRVVVGIASDRIGRKKALVLCTLWEGIMLLWLLATTSTWSLFVFGVFFGFFYGGHAPQLPALIGEMLGFENMGAILGIVSLFWGLGSAIGPFVTGYIFDVTGSYNIGFMISSVTIFIASVIGYSLKASEKAPSSL
jgi:MFS family permease